LYLFIFESLGTSELILIGIVALIFLGPRRLPEIARKIGKVMADLRSTANDFKSTWEKEVDLEEETKALRIENILDDEPEDKPVPRENTILADRGNEQSTIEVPAIKAMNREEFEAITAVREEVTSKTNGHHEPTEEAETDEPDLLSDKRNWL
jgi:Tat protein translocase TatB subunit